jgi:large subunit ribosomal protein L9
VDVILRNDVEKLGFRGDVVTVADGYARNYLIPRRLAERATPAKVAEVQRREERRARQEARTAEQAEDVAGVLAKTVLRFEVNAGPTGALFGSVTPGDVADEIWRVRKIRVDRRKIGLDEPIKRIGRYEVPIHVFEDVDVEVKTLVVPEGGELPPEEEPVPEAVATGDAVEAGDAEAGVDAEADVPDDAFDRAVDAALETLPDATAEAEAEAEAEEA